MHIIIAMLLNLGFYLLFPICFVLRFFSKKLSKQFSPDRSLKSILATHSIDKNKKRVLFYCSSAGEYEQIRPLIKELEQQNYQAHIFFFSISALYLLLG